MTAKSSSRIGETRASHDGDRHLPRAECGPRRRLARSIEDGAGIRPPFALGTFQDLEQGVRASLEQLRTSPLLLHRDAVRGFVYAVETGRLREVT